MQQKYFSENWYEATEKFVKAAVRYGPLGWCCADEHEYDIPYVMIGDGAEKIVINSGIHGIEGYFGSAAQLMFLNKIAPNLSAELLSKYTFVLIHVINGWGMQNRMREVMDIKNGGLVDLNRNFGVDFSKKELLPSNPKYELAHELLLSKPDAVVKKNAIKAFRAEHLSDGVWGAISYGQYTHPYGLFYGGSEQMTENAMTLRIYDRIMDGATGLTSVGLHTGLGRFYRKQGRVTSQIMVSHPGTHKNSVYFSNIFDKTHVATEEKAINGPVLLGDLVDCLECRYESRGIPIYTADFEIGTGEFPIMSPIYKRMDMGDARYDLLNYGKINSVTWGNLTESWYPTSPVWRKAALDCANIMFLELVNKLER